MKTIQIFKQNTAAFDVDATKCFTPLCPNEIPVAGGDEIVPALNLQASFARLRIGSKDAHAMNAIYTATPDHPQFSPLGAENADIYWNRHSIPGTEGFELLPGLPDETGYSYFVWKGIEPDLHPYGACYHDLAGKLSTGVIEYLKSQHIDTVIVGGLATDHCVKTTALQLNAAGFSVIVNLSACRGVAEESIAAAIECMTAAGILVVDTLDGFKLI